MDWADVPAWVGAIGTVTAVSLALWGAGSERRRRIRVERRAQAESIAVWPEPQRGVVLLNRSGQPVYGVVVAFLNNPGESEPDFWGPFNVLPPGTWTVPGSRRYGDVVVEGVAFTDSTGRAHWLRRGNGALDEIDGEAIAYFGLQDERHRRPYRLLLDGPDPL